MMKYFTVFLLFFFCGSHAQVKENQGKATGETYFKIMDQVATYKGGTAKLYRYVSKKLKYPKAAKKAGLEGTVYVRFVILKTGAVDKNSVTILSAEELSGFADKRELLTDDECHDAVIDLIKKMLNWNPAEDKGQVVESRIVLPVIFKL